MSAIAIVTCQTLPEPDPDQEILLEACRVAGLPVEMAAWDDPDVDWSRFRFAKFHSCWNYYENPVAFLAWMDRASKKTKFWNPTELAWANIEKGYLRELAGAGIPIVPTEFVRRINGFEDQVARIGSDDFVVKPIISAGSYMTQRFHRDQMEEAKVFAAQILNQRQAMVQPYIESVNHGGEVAVVHIDGELTHCVVKEPRFAGSDESVSVGFQPTPDIAEAAAKVIATITEPWLYARVDLMKSASGEWLLSELELIEPTLFLAQSEVALTRLVAAMARHYHALSV